MYCELYVTFFIFYYDHPFAQNFQVIQVILNIFFSIILKIVGFFQVSQEFTKYL